MKKIPTLFTRIFEGRKIVGIKDEITPGCEEAFKYGRATIKVDGSCCAIINGEFYKRYDAKKGKKPPEGAIPCCDPDPVTGHWPHWVRVDPNNPADKWFDQARNSRYTTIFTDGTYEAVGKHFNGNPYNLDFDYLVPHGNKTYMLNEISNLFLNGLIHMSPKVSSSGLMTNRYARLNELTLVTNGRLKRSKDVFIRVHKPSGIWDMGTTIRNYSCFQCK